MRIISLKQTVNNQPKMDYQHLEKEKRQKWFIRFAEKECLNVSPFYYALSTKVAADEELLNLAAFCRQGQPMPNLFLGAVHFLLLKNPTVELATYYPSINTNAKSALPFNLFKDFCLSNAASIKTILATKIVQTNALNRSAYLMPIIFSLFEDKSTINLIDIGTSAGLTLNFDLYEYDYGVKGKFGNSSVKIISEIRVGELPNFSDMKKAFRTSSSGSSKDFERKPITIKNKIGIDQNPLDIKVPENALWLKALIWPDRQQRFQRMEQAIKLAQDSTVELIKAVEVSDFKRIIQNQDAVTPLVIYHTHVLYQFTQAAKIEFWGMLDEIGKTRDFYYLAAEAASVLANDYGRTGVLVELTAYRNGGKSSKLVALTNGHADWIKWC